MERAPSTSVIMPDDARGACLSDLDDSFAKLLGTQPTDKDRQDLYRVRDALGLESNDALWLVLMALQHYQSQYETFPARIEDAARRTLQKFENAAAMLGKASATLRVTERRRTRRLLPLAQPRLKARRRSGWRRPAAYSSSRSARLRAGTLKMESASGR